MFYVLWILVEVYLYAAKWVECYKSAVTVLGSILLCGVYMMLFWFELMDICLTNITYDYS